MIDWLTNHGLELALATSAALAVGALAVWRTRAPHLRHRTAELTLLVTLAACAVVLVPLPRPGFLEPWLPQAREATPTVAAQTAAWRPIPPVQRPVEATPATAMMERANRDVARPVTRGARSSSSEGAESAPIGLAPFFLAGALLLCLHGLVASLLLRRLLRRAQPAPEWLQELLPGDGPRILVSRDARRPFCCGLRRGSIVLPQVLVRRDWTERLEAVLRHERAHLDQRHPRARALCTALAPLLYWQPLYWWLARDLRRSAELLADDMATRDFDKRRYVQALLDLADHTRRARLAEAHGVGAWGTPKDFLERMEQLIMRTRPFATRLTPTQFVTRTGCALVLVSSVSLAWGPALQDAAAVATDDPFLRSIPLLSDVFDEVREESALTAEAPVNDPITTVHDPRDPWGNRAGTQEPTHTVLLEFVAPDAATLGALLVELGDARIELSRTDHGASARRVRAEVEGMSDAGMMRFTQIDGLVLESIAVSSARDPRPSTTPDPVVTDAPQARPSNSNRTSQHPLSAARNSSGARSATPDLQARLDQVEAQLAALSTALAEIRQANSTGARDSVEIVPSDVDTVAILKGQVLSAAHDRIVIDLGSDLGVTVGTSLEVYSGNLYKGQVIVTEVTKELCSARLSRRVEGRTIEAGDNVTDHL